MKNFHQVQQQQQQSQQQWLGCVFVALENTTKIKKLIFSM
jgi:hypothetical protein